MYIFLTKSSRKTGNLELKILALKGAKKKQTHGESLHELKMC